MTRTNTFAMVKRLVMVAVFVFIQSTVLAQKLSSAGLKGPVCTYINWASYDELSDTVRLTETLAMQQLGEMVRLKKAGVQLDYYMMDAFWFEKDGAYRQWRKSDWPNGPDAWMKACYAQDIKPGLWFSTNVIHAGGKFILDAPDVWKSSLSVGGNSFCLFSGSYLNHFMQTLDSYAKKGVRIYKFDFFDVGAVTPALKEKMTAEQVKAANVNALQTALKAFRKKHPEVVLIGYNGFGGEMSNTGVAIKKTFDLSWLSVFHTMYSGDPRPADVPAMNFWRSKDIYSDHMVKYFQANGFPLNRIDNAGFMIGKTGTCYYRGNAAWKGMLLLSLARGGWMNTYYGNLELLSAEDAIWFAKAQQIYLPLQKGNTTTTFGGLPGKAEAYGYFSKTAKGGIITVVNPSQTVKTIMLPSTTFNTQQLLFTDGGFVPILNQQQVTLGPEQLAVIGYGQYAVGNYTMGLSSDVYIPASITPIPVSFVQEANAVKGSFIPSQKLNIRLIFQQYGADGIPFRSSGGSPPDGVTMEKLLTIRASQNGKAIPLNLNYDKAIWSGLSWATAEISKSNFEIGVPVIVEFNTTEKRSLKIEGSIAYVN